MQCKSPESVEMAQAVNAILLIRVHYDFRVCVRYKSVFFFQILPYLNEIKNLPVVDKGNGLVFIVDWLVACLWQGNYAQPSAAERFVFTGKIACCIWAPVPYFASHAFQKPFVFEIKSADAAHFNSNRCPFNHQFSQYAQKSNLDCSEYKQCPPKPELVEQDEVPCKLCNPAKKQDRADWDKNIQRLEENCKPEYEVAEADEIPDWMDC